MNAQQYQTWCDAFRRGPQACWDSGTGKMGYFLTKTPHYGTKLFLGWTFDDAKVALERVRADVERLATESRVSRV